MKNFFHTYTLPCFFITETEAELIKVIEDQNVTNKKRKTQLPCNLLDTASSGLSDIDQLEPSTKKLKKQSTSASIVLAKKNEKLLTKVLFLHIFL